MMYVYCPRKSTGALELVKALGARRLRDFDGKTFWDKKRKFRLSEGDVVVCWGAQIPEIEGVRILNCLENPINKLKEIQLLSDHGVPTVGVSLSDRSNPKYGVKMVPRSIYHTGGTDLLGLGGRRTDYWVTKENFESEYRVHSFNQRSIRAGIKVVRDGFTQVQEGQWKPNANLAHPWVRSFDGGWRIKYDGFSSGAVNGLRNVAHQAVKALGLTFGAVDIGRRASDGTLVVLEVNTAPGVEGGTLEAYKKAITKWVEEGTKQTPKKTPLTPDVDLD